MYGIGTYAYLIAKPLSKIGLTHIMLSMMIMFVSLYTIIEGFYKAQGMLFDCKDNDMLLSMPLNKKTIFFVRMFKFYLFQLMYDSLFILPAFIIYAYFESPGINFYLMSLVMLILLPIIPLIVASFIGYIIKLISVNFKKSKNVQTIISMLLLISIFYFSFNMESLVNNIVNKADMINDVITKIYYPINLYLSLINKFDVLKLLKLILINIVPFIIFIYLGSIYYFKIIFKSKKSDIKKSNRALTFKRKNGDVLDQKPEFEADLDGAITTPAAVELALNGIYYSLPGNGFNVIFPTVSGSFKAGTMWRQEIVSAGNAVYYSERMLPTLSFSDATEWDADYAVIKNANFLETACNRMSDGEFSGNRRAEVLGEIAYLRALAYFNILVRYCEFWDMNSEYGVVMRNEAPSVSNALKARSSVADSYQYILDQLEIAIEKAPDWKKLSQASKEAAKALKARVLLYAGKYTEAVAAVNDAIDTNSPLPEANYGDVFDKFSTTKEILFARVFDQKDATNTSTRQQCYGNSPTKKQGYWGPTNEYVELVGDDPRADAIFSKVDSLMDSRSSAVAYNLKSVKKLLNDANDMPVIFSRVSELYLIKAEALYRSGASISEAYAPIRKLRERAGAEIILPANNEELETAIFNEWMLELSFENWHEWFAMIRFAGYTEKPDFTRLLALNKTLREALEKEYEKSEAQGDNYYQRIIDRRIDAIPSSEISSNLECKQNPGY